MSEDTGSINFLMKVPENRVLRAVCVYWLILCCGISLAEQPHALVVGGGPAGLATALVLAQHHGYRVTLLEQNTLEDYTDPTRAYTYAINFRGQSFTQKFPQIHAALQEQGVASECFSVKRVPGDPNTIFDNKVITFPMKTGVYYHIARHVFAMILINALEQEKHVSIAWGAKLLNLVADTNATEIQAYVSSDDKSETSRYSASLIVGADGINSRVRSIIAESPLQFSTWSKNSAKFKVRQWKSPAFGMRVKALQLSPHVQIPLGDGSYHEVPFDISVAYGLDSIHKRPTDKLVLVLFPSRPAACRTCVIATPPNHAIWDLSNGTEAKEWFKRAFPRLNFENDTLVETDEWERFANSEGIRFPPCQLCTAMYTTSNGGNCAVVLLGDAVHAFPPDVGEGINCALQDVAALDNALTNHPADFETALEKFEQERLPEARAIVRMSRFAAPYQYEQAMGWQRIPALLWRVNTVLRILLNKLSLGFLPKPVILLKSSRVGITYQQALEMADRMTFALWTMLVVVLIRWIFL